MFERLTPSCAPTRVLTALLLTAAVLAMPARDAAAVVVPTITVPLTATPPSSTVLATISGFGPGEGLRVVLQNDDGTDAASVAVTADTAGGAGVSIAVPGVGPSFSAGSHTVLASSSTRRASSVLTVAEPGLSLSPVAAPSGGQVTATLSGFVPGDGLQVAVDDDFGVSQTLAPLATADAGGRATLVFTVPGRSPGGHTVRAVRDAVVQARSTAALTVSTPESLVLSPASGPVGTTVTATLTGYTPGDSLQINLEDDSGNEASYFLFPASPARADANGNASFEFDIPAHQEFSPGGHVVHVVRNAANLEEPSASLTVTTPETLTLSPASGPAGTTVTASLNGLNPNFIYRIAVQNDDGQIGTLSSGGYALSSFSPDSTGSATTTFTIPGTTNGTFGTFSPGGHVVHVVRDRGVDHVTLASPTASLIITSPRNLDASEALTLSPTSGPAGSAVTAMLSGFGAGDLLQVLLQDDSGDGTMTAPATAVAADGDGRATISFTIPGNGTNLWNAGGHVVRVVRGGSALNLTAPLTIVAPAPSTGTPQLIVSPGVAPAGATVSLTSSGWTPGEELYLDNAPGDGGGAAVADASGNYSTNLVLPTPRDGQAVTHRITLAPPGASFLLARTVAIAAVRSALTPSSANAGGTVTLTSTGWVPGETLRLDSPGPNDTAVQADPAGNFSTTVRLGTHFQGDATTALVAVSRARFGTPVSHTVLIAPVRASLTPALANGGGSVVLRSSGWNSGEELSVSNGVGNYIYAVASASGDYSTSLSLPTTFAGTAATHVVTVNSATNTFILRKNTVATAAVRATVTPAVLNGATTAALTSTGWASGEALRLINGSGATPTAVAADSSGAYAASLGVPSTVDGTAATHRISLARPSSAITQVHTVAIAPNTFTATPASGPAGTAVTLTASGFAPGEQLVVGRLDGTVVQGLADASGRLQIADAVSTGASPRTFAATVRRPAGPPVGSVAVARTANADTTPPTITGTTTPAANAVGWNSGDVRVAFNCTDDVAVATCSPATSVTAEGAGQYVAGEVSDFSGNEGRTTVGPINIDRTAPTVSVVGVTDGQTYSIGAVPTPTCAATDALSGLAAPCNGDTTGGDPDGTGDFTYSASAVDLAGNTATASARWTVRAGYRFDGFLPPIGTVGHGGPNARFRAGSTVPVKFRLLDGAGQSVVAAGAPLWLVPQEGGLISSPSALSRYASPPPVSSATFDRAGDHYQFNWRTTKDQAGRYWQIGVRLDDGSVRVVEIALT